MEEQRENKVQCDPLAIFDTRIEYNKLQSLRFVYNSLNAKSVMTIETRRKWTIHCQQAVVVHSATQPPRLSRAKSSMSLISY